MSELAPNYKIIFWGLWINILRCLIFETLTLSLTVLMMVNQDEDANFLGRPGIRVQHELVF